MIVTVGQSRRPAAKHYTYDARGDQYEKVSSASRIGFSEFRSRDVPWERFPDFLRVLDTSTHHYIVRGALRDPSRTRCRRAIHPHPQHGPPGLCDAPRDWLCLDIDDLATACESPRALRDAIATDSGSIVRDVVASLGPCFRGVGCVWQWSSSAALTSTEIKIHLWFRLSEPVETAVAREWVREHAPAADLALINPAQIHYTSGPVITSGSSSERLPDPLGEARIGVLDGDALAVTRDPWLLRQSITEARQQRRQARAELRSGPASASAWQRYIDVVLSHAPASGEGIHTWATRALGSVAAKVREGEFPHEAYTALGDAITAVRLDKTASEAMVRDFEP